MFVDAAIGPTTTKTAWAFGFDIGGGIEWNIPDAPGLSIGPYLRYNQVINPDSATNDDGRAWSLGGSSRITSGVRRRPPTARAARGAARRLPPLRADSDHDGIGDDEDVCKTVPQGKHPDPFKPGCPENDEDGDDVPDVDDACPVTPPGPTPDPKRPGCPLVDTDKDGIPDPEDACPSKAGPANADPAHYGCPMEKHRSAAPEEGAPPSEPASEPSTVKKRRMKQ